MASDLNPWQRVALGGYSTVLRLLAPVNVLRLKWRARAEPLYGHAIAERFGRYASLPSRGWVWVHAVSLGETRAAGALIAALREQQPGLRLLLTHGTATGREAGRDLLLEGDRQVWLPLDTPAGVRRFLAQFRPAVGVLMETEVWPNLLREAHRAGVTMVLANGRLSERSLRRGRRFNAVLRPAVQSLSLVLAQTDDDARRFRSAGATNVVISGNLKFDMAPDEALLRIGRAWQVAAARPIVLAAVTREGEEAVLLRAWAAWVNAAAPGAARPLLVVVPRHPQRFDEVAALMAAAGLRTVRRSSWDQRPSSDAMTADAWLGDSMREMPAYYAAASVALLGGSFEPLGGQNLIEAAACGCPLIMGPHTFNFAEAAQLSLAAGAALRVDDLPAALAGAMALVAQPDRAARMSGAALAFAAGHRGAAQRMARGIVQAMLQASVSRLSAPTAS